MVQRSCVYDRLGRLVATEHHEQIAYHRSLLVIVEVDNVLVGKLVKCHLHHRNSTLDDLLAGGDDSRSLLATQHHGCNLRSIGEVVDACLHDLNPCQRQTLVELLLQLLVDSAPAAR